MFEAHACLADLLYRYAYIEASYLQVNHENVESRGVSQLENAIIDVYVAILKYSAAVRKASSAGMGSTSNCLDIDTENII